MSDPSLSIFWSPKERRVTHEKAIELAQSSSVDAGETSTGPLAGQCDLRGPRLQGLVMRLRSWISKSSKS